MSSYVHCVPKKPSHFYFWNNSVKNEPILIIFGTLNPEGTWHYKVVILPTSPTYCSYYTGGTSKVIFQQRLVETWAGLQQSVVDEATDQLRKRLGACVHALGGHSEHSLALLPFILPHNTTGFFRATHFLRGKQCTFELMNYFIIRKVYCVKFSQVRWANLQSTSVKFLQDDVFQ